MNLNEPIYETITYDLDFAEDGDDEEVSQLRFNQLQYKLRRIQRHRKITRGFLEGTDRQDVELSYLGRRISCKMKVDDFYFVGYQKVVPNSLLWEAYTTAETQCLQGSRSLRFSSNYSGNVPKRKLGGFALREAFNTLWKRTPHADNGKFPTTELENAFQCIALNICEAARFQPVFLCVYNNIHAANLLVPPWMQKLVNKWSNYSGVARQQQPTTFRIPEELQQEDLDHYNNYEFPLIINPDTPAAPYFARLLIRVLHIP